MTDKIPAVEIFGPDPDLAHHVCCSCCDGYCSLEDVPIDAFTSTAQLYVVTSGGIQWVTDKAVSIRADLIDLDDKRTGKITTVDEPVADDWTLVADCTHSPDEAIFQARYLDLLDKAGVEIRSNGGGGPHAKHALYRNAQHIGWIMPARNDSNVHLTRAVKPADLEAVRALHDRLNENIYGPEWMARDDINATARAYNLAHWITKEKP